MDNKVLIESTKWSAITEVFAKLASPLSNIILARLLAPEVFGLVATYTLVTSFAEVFTDSGFQKYLIQHEFKKEESIESFTNTAFCSNLILSFLFWVIIFVFRSQISGLVGSPGHGLELSVLCFQIPLFAFSSIQQALLRRDFRFKDLAPIRFATSFVPIFVTIPLAAVLKNSWAIIIGYVVKEMLNAFLLSLKSQWKPRLSFSSSAFKAMISDCSRLMADSFMVWLTAYAGTLVISQRLSSYYLGVYRTGYTTITSYLSIIFVITQPVLFSALSRCQNNNDEFNQVFGNYIKYVAYLIIPLGIAIFLYHEVIISLLLGSQWYDANIIVSMTGLTYPFLMLFGQFNSVFFRAKGRPTVAFIVQTIFVCIMLIAFIIASNQSFEVFCITAGLVNICYPIISSFALIYIFKFPFLSMIKQWVPIVLGTVVLFIVGRITLRLLPDSSVFQIVSGIISTLSYLFCLIICPTSRIDLRNILCAVKIKKENK